MEFWICDVGKPMVEPDACTDRGYLNCWFRAAWAGALTSVSLKKKHNQVVKTYSYQNGVYVWQHTHRAW